MKKYKIVIIVVSLFIIGVFSVSVSTGNFFFATKYYKTPLKAYNAGAAYDAVYGNTKASKEIGLLNFDDKNALFLGELTENSFVAAQMKLKDGRYAAEGTAIFYDFNEDSNLSNYNQTDTVNGHKKWAITYDKSDTENLSGVSHVESYRHSNGAEIYIVIFDD